MLRLNIVDIFLLIYYLGTTYCSFYQYHIKMSHTLTTDHRVWKLPTHSVVIQQILPHDFLRQIEIFFVKLTCNRFPLVKMAKMQLQNHYFREFRLELRRNELNQSCRGGFKL